MYKTRGISKVYMAIVPLLPVLAQYNILSGRLDMDVIAMVGVMVFLMFQKRTIHVRHPKLTFTLLVYIVAVTVINLMIGQLFVSTGTIAMRAGRYCIYLFIVFFLTLDEVDYTTFMSGYRVVIYAAFSYILLQALFYYGVGIRLPNRFDGQLTSARDAVARLSSFYSEPADMAYSVTPFVVCSLFGPKYMPNKDTRFRDAVVATVSVLLTTSSQGTVCVMLVWAGWLLTCFRTKKSSAKGILAILAIFAVGILMDQFGILDYSLSRLDLSKDSAPWEARQGGFIVLRLLTPLQKVFGAGYGNYLSEKVAGLDTYGNYINYSSIAESLFTLGYVGTAILFALIGKAYLRGYKYQKVLTLALLFFSIGGCPLTGKYMPLYFCLMMLGKFDPEAHSAEETKALFA